MDVLVIEDHALVREGLCLLLGGMGLFGRCHEAACMADAREVLRAEGQGVGLVLLDLGLPDVSGLEALDGVLAERPGCRVVVCSGGDDPARIRDCFARGASGYLTKNASGPALQSALETVLRGERHVPPEILAEASAPHPSAPLSSGSRGSEPSTHLTPRQRDVLQRLASGLSNKEIAAELGMSPATVRAHLSSVFRVLGVENRTQAATHAIAVALLDQARATS